ncbi:MAG: peptidylprolyl isomerase [Bacteroidales bacterium]|nr:peptidylprolyl isomerase [Bacteroidales bacterium]
MKKTVLFLFFSVCLSICTAQIKDPIIMDIGGNAVTKSEFEYIWNKNSANAVSDQKSLDEYVDLFVNFKLKVAEAKAQGIDTTKAFINELSGYRRQLAAPYLTDKDVEEALVKEAYERIKTYVETSHILISVRPDDCPEDTLKAWQKISKIYQRAIQGEDFAKLAKENSEDGSKNNGGYLGCTTGGHFVYDFENAAFNTPVGEISKPFRTQFGYHIVKVHSRYPANGLYRSGHILKIVSPTATEEEKAAAKDSIFKIYNALKNGEDFRLYATKHSDDKNAASHNGEYGFLFCGSLPIEYEKNIFNLKVGEYSEPFQSKYGWHIVKALEFKPYPEMDALRENINTNIARDKRSELGKRTLVEKLKKEYNYTCNKESIEAFFESSGYTIVLAEKSVSDIPLFTLNGVTFTQKQFAAFLKNRKNLYSSNLNDAFDSFVQQEVLSYEDSQLEKKYPEFGHLMQEYSDGILLFDVSNREVWEKASIDTVGLESYFNANKAKYAWDKPHYKGFIIYCADAQVAKKAKKMIKKMPADSIAVVLKRTFNTDSTTLVKMERGLYAQGNNANVDFLVFKQGKLEPKEGFPEIFIQGKKLKKGPESYTDVRGLVISDYQNYLEQKWIEKLKGKFQVNVYKDVVNTVNKN